ncbi:MAG: hypothetical protein KIT87_05520 [Anaerolineae bacterium]|nr:hypothetical protein [Anaerolineae bacterium]
MLSRLRSPAAARVAGAIATVGFAVTIVLQLLLAVGVLPVSMAWGGTQTVLTVPLRLASLAAVAVLAVCAAVIRRRAGLSGQGPGSRSVTIFAWVITLFLALNTLGNFASVSRGETLLFGPLSLALVLACLVVASSRSEA